MDGTGLLRRGESRYDTHGASPEPVFSLRGQSLMYSVNLLVLSLMLLGALRVEEGQDGHGRVDRNKHEFRSGADI